jgi:hypothetical protein
MLKMLTKDDYTLGMVMALEMLPTETKEKL